MDAGEQQDIVWTYKWEIHPAPPGIEAWLVDAGGQIEPTRPAFFAFQIREAAIRTFATVPRYVGTGRPRDQLRFAAPPGHFMDVTSGDASLIEQEIFAFLPGSVPTSEGMPWFRVGMNVFFQEEEARQVAQERREAAGTAVAVAAVGAGPGGGSGSDDSGDSE